MAIRPYNIPCGFLRNKGRDEPCPYAKNNTYPLLILDGVRLDRLTLPTFPLDD